MHRQQLRDVLWRKKQVQVFGGHVNARVINDAISHETQSHHGVVVQRNFHHFGSGFHVNRAMDKFLRRTGRRLQLECSVHAGVIALKQVWDLRTGGNNYTGLGIRGHEADVVVGEKAGLQRDGRPGTD
jgi:hypothetical protein